MKRKICKKHGLIMDHNTGCPECFHQKEIVNQKEIEKIINLKMKKGLVCSVCKDNPSKRNYCMYCD